MKLIQILLPLEDNEGKKFPSEFFANLNKSLVEKFGGLTAHLQSPATGLWATPDEDIAHDQIIIFEIMTEELDKAWWRNLRKELETQLRQRLIIIRVHTVENI
ncbi:MAG: hypothetical protein JWQ71_726 [Pedosphaera sp.]|nr:hypothetical protein [Pedosphaera sp.]